MRPRTKSEQPTRRARWTAAAVTAAAAGALAAGWPHALAAGGDEITRTGEAIHQEVIFKAPRKRVYEALTDAKQFDKVVQLSAAVKGGMRLGNSPTELSDKAGGEFAVFGGHIGGRQVELVPNERIVQAWRVATWDAGVYSVAKFVLTDQDGGTKLVFDHVGFPKGQAEHLAEGWRTNYWEPLAKALE